MRKVFLIIAFSLSLYSATLSSSGNSLGASDMFSQENISIGVKLGSASVGNRDYTILGVSGSYFILDDLSIGIGYEKWFSGTPSIHKLTVESTYYIPISESVRPYAGVLYRRIFISDSYGDVNAYGYRGGVAFVKGRLLISAGIVQERYESSRRVLDSTETYGEVTVGISF